MVDLSISWKAWREQAGGFQIGHSSSLLSLPSTNQYPTNVASTNTTSAAPDALVDGVSSNQSFSPPTVGSAVSLRNYSACRQYCRPLLLAFVGDCAGEEPGSTTKTYPCQHNPAPKTSSWILDFVRINIIGRVSAQNAVDSRLSKKLIPVTSVWWEGKPCVCHKSLHVESVSMITFQIWLCCSIAQPFVLLCKD